MPTHTQPHENQPPDPAGIEDENSRRLHELVTSMGYTYATTEARAYPRDLYRRTAHLLGLSLDDVARDLTVERFRR